MTDVRSAAHRLISHGAPIFPCRQDKRPHTLCGFKDASTDPAQIKAWWDQWPDALIGVPAGIKFVVVDFDTRHADADEWRRQNIGRFPATRLHVTRSGGFHLLFKPDARIGCTAGKLGPHIDTRGTGGYIVWWAAHGFDIEKPNLLADIPDWVVEALRPQPQISKNVARDAASPDRKLDGLIRTVANAPEGERNAILFWASCRAAELGTIGPDYATALLTEAAARAGLARHETLSTIRSGFRAARKFAA